MKQKLNRYHSRQGVELICPHCGGKWTPGHFVWYAFVCVYCKKEVNKTDWLIEKKEV